MKLTLDTTGATTVRIMIDNEVMPVKRDAMGNRDTVRAIADALGDAGKKLSDITEITVMTGPGSFTGIRVGIAVARILGLLLLVPVNGKPATEPIIPRYEPSKFDS